MTQIFRWLRCNWGTYLWLKQESLKEISVKTVLFDCWHCTQPPSDCGCKNYSWGGFTHSLRQALMGIEPERVKGTEYSGKISVRWEQSTTVRRGRCVRNKRQKLGAEEKDRSSSRESFLKSRLGKVGGKVAWRMFQHHLTPASYIHRNNNSVCLSCRNSTSKAQRGVSPSLFGRKCRQRDFFGMMKNSGEGGISYSVCVSAQALWWHTATT